MNIKTSRLANTQNTEYEMHSEGNRQSRKKATQKLNKSHIVSRHAIRILGKLLSGILILALIFSVFIYAYTSDKFNLGNITFYGCKELDSRKLETIVREKFSQNILHINLAELQTLLEQEIWAKQVEIRRVLPSDLLIFIRERTPSAILEVNGKLMIADRDGIILDKYDLKYGKLDVPVFKGILGKDTDNYRLNQPENTARIRQGLSMMAEIESGSASYGRSISEVDLSDRNNLKIMLVDNTAEVFIGDQDYLKRFQTLMDHLGELKAQSKDIATIDLRFDGQIIFVPRPSPGESPGKISKELNIFR